MIGLNNGGKVRNILKSRTGPAGSLYKMIKSALWPSLVVIGLFIEAHAQNISQEVFPSDEEIYEAYLRGEIDYHTYQNLTEIFEQGIDSADLYLLDEIPNLNYFMNTSVRDFPELEREQAESFTAGSNQERPRPYSGNAGLRRFQSLEEDGQGRNQYYLRYGLPSNGAFNAWLNGDSAGNREWASRTLKYRNNTGAVKRIIVGNFTARYGLGLSVGYSGRLLQKDSTTRNESFLFPDYGGFNGIYIEGGRRSDAIKMLVHYDRNKIHQVQASAISFSKRYRQFRGEGIFVVSRLQNRETSMKYDSHQLGYSFQYQGGEFVAAFESVLPRGSQRGFPATIFEAQYNNKPVNLSLSAWRYAKDYVNPFGGGRSGDYYRAVSIDAVEFEFSDRRTDQRGILLKGISALGGSSTYEISFSAYGRDRFQRSAKMSTGLEIPLTKSARIRGDYRYAEKIEAGELTSSHKIRLEYILKMSKLFMRNYLGFTIDRNLRKYFSLFSRTKTAVSNYGNIEAWLNLDKIDSPDGTINYFYGYLKETINVTKNLEMGMKYSYRYNRDYSIRSSSTFLFTAEMSW